jgi:hypothetical protein
VTWISSLDIVRVGVAAGFRASERLSLGIGVSYFRGDVDTETIVAQPAGCNCGTPEDRTDWALNAGFLWSPVAGWNVGGFYRGGPTFTLDLGSRSGLPPQQPEAATTAEISLPDTFGLGTAARLAGGALTLALEWDRVQYSSLNTGVAGTAVGLADFAYEDVDEFHVGGEYAFLRADPVIAVRAGVWHEPGKRSWVGDPPAPDVEADQDLLHGALGVGWAWRRFQLDLGLDASKRTVTLSLSGIVNF